MDDDFKVNVNTNPAPSAESEEPTTPAPTPESVIKPGDDQDPFKADEPVVPPVEKAPKNKGSGKSSKVSLVLLILVLLGATGYGVYYWQNKQVKDAQAQSAAQTAKVTDLSKQLSDAQAAAAKTTGTATTATFTEKLPTGKTVSYPLTQANATILWWYSNQAADSKEPNGTYLYVSSSKLAHFISTIPTDYLNKACAGGTGIPIVRGFNSGNIDMFAFAPADKSLTHRQAANCVDVLADASADKTGTYRAEAKKVSDEATADIQAWAKTVTVK